MSASGIAQRCWIHGERAAACRCPGCARSYCRECVTEHDGRLLCAACLRGLSGPASRGGRWRALAGPAAAVAGFVLAWMAITGAGEVVIAVRDQLQEQQWQKR